MRQASFLAAVLFALSLNATPAEACSCITPNLVGAYNSYDAVFSAVINSEATVGSSNYYVATVGTGYKGCFHYGEQVTLVTHIHGATCGVSLTVGENYLITASNLFSLYSINLCGYNRPFGSLTSPEVEFLDTRFNCGSCVNSNQVNCLVNPCDNVSCPDGECVANYCGGCNAEFFDESFGNPVCNDCATNADCGFGQVCSAGKRCRVACGSNGDCDGGEVCGLDNTCGPSFVLRFPIRAAQDEP